MIAYTARRLGLSALVAFGVVVLTFVIARVVPGDPAAGWAGPRASQAERDRVRAELGLDDPLHTQIVNYVAGVLRGDWGISVRTHRPVLDDLSTLLPSTLQLVLAGLLIGLLVGIPAGLLAARWQGRLPDVVVRVGAVISGSMPVFWLALLIQMFFATRLGLLPVAGMYDQAVLAEHPLTRITGLSLVDALLTGNWAMAASVFDHLLLPALAVAAYPVAVIARLVRASVLDTLGETHVQMVRALGFRERSVLGRFALRLSWNPVLQTVALIFGSSLVNTFLVEAVFNYPGLGGYAAASATVLDVPAIVGVTLLVALLYIAANLIVDLLHAALDPRIRLR
ncbi:ABC transporter permease [Marinactinospora thermotolerans]|uniref:Peptide/nickel transport system permease protein n=1 Tax=Marinactinospora thermotolerans DSM 45154 TaxID=1122192 RepID=A0A1T4M9J5_9ACTN|nr:ABC transporter permease [Marinactinospora thermotolerans]SJZ63384.1 peptide/nickel transport system permease protein [Marinactinospora thermotolerans DSM 45154]